MKYKGAPVNPAINVDWNIRKCFIWQKPMPVCTEYAKLHIKAPVWSNSQMSKHTCFRTFKHTFPD